MSRISDRIVRERWNLAEEIYSTLVGEGATGRMMSVIDLTWELQKQESVSKSHTTTFMVVPDHAMKSDAEFGQNIFDPPCSSRQKKGHSSTSMGVSHLFQSCLSNSNPESLPNVERSEEEETSKSRSQAGKSSSSSSHRRRTVPSTSGRLGYPSKEEFIRREIVAGLRSDAESQWEKHEQPCLETDAEDDESFASSKGKQQSSLNTSIDSKERVYTKRGGR
jgi:hypothetical protein